MKTIVVGNQKGGDGKTTTARHLAFYGESLGYRVLCIDFDVQGNFSSTLLNYGRLNGYALDESAMALRTHASGLFEGNAALTPIECSDTLRLIAADGMLVEVGRQELETVVERLKASMAQVALDFDVCVIDTSPSVTNLLIGALAVADYAVCPCTLDQDSVTGMMAFFSNISRVSGEAGLNTRLAPVGILANKVNKTRKGHKTMLTQLRSELGELMMPMVLHYSVAIDLAKERPVWQREKRGHDRYTPAANEMKQVCGHIYSVMQLNKD